VFICPDCHHNIDNGEWGNAAKHVPGRGRVYFAWDIHGNTLIEKDLDSVLSAAAEAAVAGQDTQDEPATSSVQVPVPDAGSSAAAPSAGQSKEESDGRRQGSASDAEGLPEGAEAGSEADAAGGGGDGRHMVSGADRDASVPAPLTHEQRVAIARHIKDTEWNRQWHAGDTGNAWIAELGESAEQYLSDFGYVHESLANILRVCAKIPPAYRNGNLRFSHHVVVAGENLEDVEMHLAECEEKQWSVAEFRRQRKGTKPRVKRWSLEELKKAVDDYEDWTSAHTKANTARWFLDWLEEQA
jgi:hypothetical protein